MTVQVRLTRGQTPIRRRRRAEHVVARPEVPANRARSGGPLQDEALYSCQCGFVFQAPVSTSVGCPHCGGAQAW